MNGYNNSKGVDPNIPQIVVLFDIPMGGGFSFAQRSDQTAIDIEEGSKPFWTADGKACVAPVRLKPGKTYEILLNIEPFTGFRSVDGVKAEGLFYTFSTARAPVSEEGRQKYADRVLTPNDNAPDSGPSQSGSSQSAKESAKPGNSSSLSPELQKKANEAFQTMIDRSRFWLLGKTQAKSWAYHAKVFSPTKKTMEVLEHDISYDPAKGIDWTLMRGTSCSGIAQAVAVLFEKDPTQVQWIAAEFGSERIRLAFTVSQPIRISYGNGLMRTWYGQFSHNKVERGVIILDAKTMLPQTAYTNEGAGERFGDYVKLADNVYAPTKIRAKYEEMNFLLEFKIYEPDLWLLDKSTYSVKLSDGEDFGSVVEISDVYVNDAPAKEK